MMAFIEERRKIRKEDKETYQRSEQKIKKCIRDKNRTKIQGKI